MATYRTNISLLVSLVYKWIIAMKEFILVPLEPTDEMVEALAGIVSEMFGIDDCYEGFAEAYKKMLQASPNWDTNHEIH